MLLLFLPFLSLLMLLVRDKTSKYFENRNQEKGRNFHSFFVYRKKDGIRYTILLHQKIKSFFMAENLFLRPFWGRKNDPLKLKGGRVRDKTSKYFENRNLEKRRNFHSFFVYRKKDGIRYTILLHQKIKSFYMAENLFLRPF